MFLIVGDRGLGEHNVGDLFQRAAGTYAGTLRSAGHDVDMTRLTTAIASGMKIRSSMALIPNGPVFFASHDEYAGFFLPHGIDALPSAFAIWALPKQDQ